jgi:hypothetical protein
VAARVFRQAVEFTPETGDQDFTAETKSHTGTSLTQTLTTVCTGLSTAIVDNNARLAAPCGKKKFARAFFYAVAENALRG